MPNNLKLSAILDESPDSDAFLRNCKALEIGFKDWKFKNLHLVEFPDMFGCIAFNGVEQWIKGLCEENILVDCEVESLAFEAVFKGLIAVYKFVVNSSELKEDCLTRFHSEEHTTHLFMKHFGLLTCHQLGCLSKNIMKEVATLEDLSKLEVAAWVIVEIALATTISNCGIDKEEVIELWAEGQEQEYEDMLETVCGIYCTSVFWTLKNCLDMDWASDIVRPKKKANKG